MDDAYGYEERNDDSGCAQITAGGNFLCVQHEGQLRYIYRRVAASAGQPAPEGYRVHAGALYRLAWVEGDE